MTLVEAAELLTLISQYNGMTVDKAKAVAWHDMIGHLDFGDAREGVLHYFRSGRTEWLQPGHLFVAVKEARAAQQSRKRAQVARTAPAIESRSTAGLSEAEKAQKRSERVHSPEVARALAEARAKTGPGKRSALKINGSIGSRRDRERGHEPASQGRPPKSLGSLLSLVKLPKEDAA